MHKIVRVFLFSLLFLSYPFAFANEQQNKDSFSFYEANFSTQWISDHNFVYNSDLINFDLREYLKTNAPHLLQHTEFISHWSGYYSINPKVLLTLIDMQSGLISQSDLSKSQQKPLDGLAKDVDFKAQVKEVLAVLHTDYYAYQQNAQQRKTETSDTVNAATFALMNLFRGDVSRGEFALSVDAKKLNFVDAYQQLFPAESISEANKTEGGPQGAQPPTGFLQLPWKIGESWGFGGVHTTTGGSTGAMSSLDFFNGGGGWGIDTSNDFVVASHAGTATVFSSCSVRITAANGWATQYYHLDSLTVSSGDTVAANQTIGVYADNEAQALCQGGSSTGPHVHWSLLDNGTYSSLSGVDISGYLVHPGRHSYDTDHAFMWIERNGTKYFAFSSLLNDFSTKPGAATLNSPSGAITDTTPTYTWNAVSNSTWYYLWVDDSTGNRIKQWYTAAQAGCASGTGTCSVTPTTVLASGSGTWWVLTWSASGTGPWSSGLSFSVSAGGLPPAGTLVSPTGAITDSTPTYSWNAVSNSIWYYLWVNDSTGNRIRQWYTAAQAGCSSGTGACSVTPALALADGSGVWWIQTWNSSGYGPWSSGLNFSVSAVGPPPAASAISPAGAITDTTPTYSWNAVYNSTWYQLWVNDASGNRIQYWYTAAEAGCASGTGTCSLTPSTVLVNGSGVWWIQTWNPSGYGPWNAGISFTIN